jgi:predicted permease
MTTLAHDVVCAVRTLRKAPAFAAIAIATLAVGIGANTAIVSVIDSLLFRPPHFRHVDRLVYIFDTNPGKVPPGGEPPPSPGNALDWRERARSFDAIALWRNWYFSIRDAGADAGPPESVRGVRVSPSFFAMLGVDAALGRTFRADESQPGRDRVVVLAHRVWTRRFAADPSAVGRRLTIDGRPFTVVGVLPEDFQFYQPDLDLWMPLAEDAALRDRQNHSTMVFARLAPRVSLAQAQDELDAVTRQLAAEHPDTNAGWGARVAPLYPSRDVRDVRPALIVLLVASAFVLLIACANAANLLLGRAIARQREIAIRAAIGASRWQLIRHTLTESLLLAAASGAAGLLVARAGIRLLVPLLPHAGTNQGMGTFGPMVPALDVRVLAFSVAAAAATGIAFGVVPAVQTTRREFLRLTASSSARSGAGRALVCAELTLAIVLLVSASLLLESFWRLQDVRPGFRADHLITMQVWLPKTTYPAPERIRAFYERFLQRVERLPGVRSAGAVSFRPFLGMAMSARIDVEGRAAAPADQLFAGYDVVTPGYLRVLGQPLVRGRDLADSDTEETPGVVVVNETLARQLWPNRDPIGERIRPAFSRTDVPWAVDAPARWLTVVGVAADIREFRLNEQTRPLMYVSHRQFASSFMYLVARTDVAPGSVSQAIQRELAAIDPDQPVSNVRTMDQAIAEATPRFDVTMLALFAAVGVLLASVGVYGVTSHAVGLRTREIGIRMALGASAADVLAMVIREALRIGALGVALGLLGSIALTRALAGMLYGVTPGDLGAFVAASAALVAATLAAAYVPARRAARVQPVIALRAE